MTTFLEAQLDFIVFLHGLAFILLGVNCFTIARGAAAKDADFQLLGWFGLVHGIGEWLNLSALVIGDDAGFQVARSAVTAVSYLFLLEFARREAIRLGARLPAGWIYLPLVGLVAATGVLDGVGTAGSVARALLGFAGAIGTALVLMVRAYALTSALRRLVLGAAAGFALYGIASLVMPDADFWPASALHQNWFMQRTGLTIELVRGALGCGLAVLIWAIAGRLRAVAIDSDRYAAYLRRHFYLALSTLALILVCGWIMTDILSDVHRQNVENDARSDLNLLVNRLGGETVTVEAMVKSLAGARGLLSLLTADNEIPRQRTQEMIDRYVESSDATLAQVLDVSGAVVASSDSRELALFGAANAGSKAYFRTALAGSAGHQFEREPDSGLVGYIASYPVRSEDGAVVGVAMLKKVFATQDGSDWGFERPFYFVDADGVVMLSNRLDALNRPLWPLGGRATPAVQFGAAAATPLRGPITGSAWTSFDGSSSYILRGAVPNSRWSMLIVNPSAGMFASRFLGIIITLQLALTALFHFIGKEHGVRDNLQMQRRQALQQLADILEIKATTDALTGLFNRAKFDASLQLELARAERYGNSLSLVVYDVDHFKHVNDIHGHQAGDRVLIQLSNLVSRGIRQTDLLTRWGGEEFFLLLPDSDGPTAALVAEKLRSAIAQAPFDQVGGITCSFGVTEFVSGDTAESLVARADNALYRAKLNGRNRVEFDASTVLEFPRLAPAA